MPHKPTKPSTKAKKRQGKGRYNDKANWVNARGTLQYNQPQPEPSTTKGGEEITEDGEETAEETTPVPTPVPTFVPRQTSRVKPRVSYAENDSDDDLPQLGGLGISDDMASQNPNQPATADPNASSNAAPTPATATAPGNAEPVASGNTAPAASTTATASTPPVAGITALTASLSMTTQAPAATIPAAAIGQAQARPVPPSSALPVPTPSSTTAPRSGSAREKKDSRKKREAKGGTTLTLKQAEDGFKEVEAPLRFKLDGNVTASTHPGKPATFVPANINHTMANVIFNTLSDSPMDNGNNNYKYGPCVPDEAFVATKVTTTEQAPYEPRFSFHAHGPNMVFSEDGLKVSNNFGYESARANVVLKEGVFYWEVKVLSNGIKEDGTAPPLNGGYLRVGIMRGESNLERNVGADGYSYGVCDLKTRIVHGAFTHYIDGAGSFRIGDVFGLRLTLPPLEIHKKVVDGTYNPAVDGPETWSNLPSAPVSPYVNIVRDRNPFPIKNKPQLFFEQPRYDNSALKDCTMNDIMKKGWNEGLKRLGVNPPTRNANQTAVPNVAYENAIAPNPNHPDPCYRTLPGSKLELFKNGTFVAVLFQNLLAFLLPAAKLHNCDGRPAGREHVDDGSLGYYPAVSAIQGGAAEIRFKAPFWHGPPAAAEEAGPSTPAAPPAPTTKSGKKNKGKAKAASVPVPEPVLSSMEDRYNEQIAEDIVWDLVDEVERFFADEGLEAPVVAAAAGAADV